MNYYYLSTYLWVTLEFSFYLNENLTQTHIDFMPHIQLWESKGYLFSKVVLNNIVLECHSALESNAKLIAIIWDLLL